MLKIDIMPNRYPLLILPYQSGITFYQQTGGLLCSHHEIEGMLLPIPCRETASLYHLARFLGSLDPGCFRLRDEVDEDEIEYDPRTIAKKEAHAIDVAFLYFHIPLVVDHTRLSESTEAWLPVRVQEKSWFPHPSEEDVQEAVQIINKHTTVSEEDMRSSLLGNQEMSEDIRSCAWRLDALEPLAGKQAIFTWENCD